MKGGACANKRDARAGGTHDLGSLLVGYGEWWDHRSTTDTE